MLNVLFNYFDGPTKLFLDLYLTEFLKQQNRYFHILSISHNKEFFSLKTEPRIIFIFNNV